MSNDHTLLSLLENSSVDLKKTITSTVENGGAVSYQLIDLIQFIVEKKLSKEIEFLLHLLQHNKLTQNGLESFLKHLIFDTTRARLFLQWQRSRSF